MSGKALRGGTNTVAATAARTCHRAAVEGIDGHDRAGWRTCRRIQAGMGLRRADDRDTVGHGDGAVDGFPVRVSVRMKERSTNIKERKHIPNPINPLLPLQQTLRRQPLHAIRIQHMKRKQRIHQRHSPTPFLLSSSSCSLAATPPTSPTALASRPPRQPPPNTLTTLVQFNKSSATIPRPPAGESRESSRRCG